MRKLFALTEKIQRLNVVKEFEDFVNDNPSMFLDALKKQMYQGRSGKGDIGLYNSIAYSMLKSEMNPQANGKVDLYYEGKFYEGMTFETSSTNSSMEIRFYSEDEKNDHLTEKYGEFIWVFDAQTISEIKKHIVRDFKII